MSTADTNEQATADVIQLSSTADYSESWDKYEHSFLIRAAKHYKVFLDPDGRLDWVTSPEYDAQQLTQPTEIQHAGNAVLGRIAIAEATPCEALELEVKRHFMRLLGEAMVCVLEDDFATAEKMIDAALQFQRIRKEELSRSWYLTAALSTTGIFLGVAVLIWLVRDWFSATVGTAALDMVMYAATGSMGAVLSVIVRSGKLHFDSSSGRPLHILEASSRIVAGAISAVLAVLAVKSGLVLSALVNTTNLPYVLFLAAAGAGSAERYATSIISRFESAGEGAIVSSKSHSKDTE